MVIADVTTAIRNRFKSFRNATGGNVMIITTLAAIPVVGSVGLAIDYMRAVRASEELQHVADAAALAAASAQKVTGSSSEKLAQRAEIATNYITDSVAKVSDIELVGTPSVITGPNTIDVKVQAKVKGSFINVLNAIKKESAEIGDGSLGDAAGSSSTDVDLTVKSKVAFSEDAYLCLLSMNPTQAEAIYFQGNSKFMSTCSVHANSNDETKAIRTWGNAEAFAASFTARGGWMGSGFDPTPLKTGAWVDDPYNNSKYVMALPTPGTCMNDATTGLPLGSGNGATRISTTVGALVKNESKTLPPGTYCGGIAGKTSAQITLQKGVYILKDGDLVVDAQSKLIAEEGTVIYLTGDASNVDITSGAEVTLVAPNDDNTIATDDAYAWRGWAIMQDRVTGVGNTNSIYSKGGVNITGGLYTPSQKLVVWANGDMNADSEYFPMIVDTLNMNGTATLFVHLDWDEEHLPEPIQLKQAGKVFVSQ